MKTKPHSLKRRSETKERARPRLPGAPRIGALLESKSPRRRPLPEYRRLIRAQYDGIPGALTAFTGKLTLHEALAHRLIGAHAFDVRGCKSILDAGCGNGRYAVYLVEEADPDANITGFDYSQGMLRRARERLGAEHVTHVAADLERLPYADAAFDAAVCGWVLEHLPDPKPGLAELARVLQPGGRMLLLTTENTFNGAVCSRLWNCRTYDRRQLRQACEDCGLGGWRELWFSPVHRALKLGGIVAEVRKRS
jgi:SAM-dependent methyltransferase